MKTLSMCSSLLIVTLCSITAQAQTETARTDKSSSATVTATASGERVRFMAPSSVVQIRLEVYDSAGKKVFDNEVRGGNVLDWHLQDARAEPLADDTYLCVVSVKSLSGRVNQKIGSVRVEKNSADVRLLDASQMTAQQSEAIGPVDENASLAVLNEDVNWTPTVIAHNGEEGQITRGRGALSFRIGDFFSGKDVEQMRLTEEGNLGIGITHPQARLDVDGLIRASQGIVFPDGSIQYSAATKTLGARSTMAAASHQSKSKNSSRGQEHIDLVLHNYVPKFTDDGGTLGNTLAPIYETDAGNVGIGTTNPDPFKLNVNGALNIVGSNLYLGGHLRFTDNPAAGYTNFVALNGNLTNFDGVNYEQLNLFNPGGDKAIHLAQTANGSQIASTGAGNTALALQPSGGNVGIGTTTPGRQLELVNLGSPQLRLRGAGLFGKVFDFWVGDAALWIQEYTAGGSLLGTHLALQSGGNVGIGTINPAAKLDVSGDLAITNGALKVTGAGVGTNTSVFIHVKTANNTCGGSGGLISVIDNPYANGNPNAMLFVTRRDVGAGGGAEGVVYFTAGSQPPGCDFLVGHWAIFLDELYSTADGAQFNVMVIKP